MAHTSSRPHATAALLDDEPEVFRLATCPMCHTRASLTQSAVEAGGDGRCVRCGQFWDVARLAAVAAYAAWVVERDDVGCRARTEGDEGTALSRDLPTEQLGGRT
jgi:uncharacterized Zn finger protein